jgi:hypothetical protein
MNTQVNIIASIILIIIFLPIFLLNKTGSTHLKKLKKIFDTIVKDNNLKLDQSECWANTCIGIDISQQKLLYKNGLESDNYQIINLKDINACELIKSTSQKRGDKKVVNELKALDLKLSMKSNKASIILNFYDANNSYAEDFELKRIEKWIIIINNNLVFRTVKNVA